MLLHLSFTLQKNLHQLIENIKFKEGKVYLNLFYKVIIRTGNGFPPKQKFTLILFAFDFDFIPNEGHFNFTS